MTDQQPESTITTSQLVGMLNAVDLDKVRDADGAIDGTKLAALVAALLPDTTAAPRRSGPTATFHNGGGASHDSRKLAGGTGREMFEQRHRRSKIDE